MANRKPPRPGNPQVAPTSGTLSPNAPTCHAAKAHHPPTRFPSYLHNLPYELTLHHKLLPPTGHLPCVPAIHNLTSRHESRGRQGMPPELFCWGDRTGFPAEGG